MADIKNMTSGSDSRSLFERARRIMPGGVNSPVRSFQAVGGNPVYMASGKGARLRTVEGRELLDFCGSWGALLFGHAREEICDAVARAAYNGTSFGANTAGEVEFAERLKRLAPELEMLRLVNSGTEAVMTAVRVARGYTGRTILLKFAGCYHGHADTVMVEAGSGLLSRKHKTGSSGMPASMMDDVITAPYNSVQAVSEIIEIHKDKLAAILVEPVAANMGLIQPKPGFLEALREMTNRCGALLIFDEVITGFRFGPSTWASLSGVTPDLTCLGKIIGGGLPMGAVGGRASVMSSLAPTGSVYQAGTLSGNPLAVAAGLATLNLIDLEPPYERLRQLGRCLTDGIQALNNNSGSPITCSQLGSAFTIFHLGQRPENVVDAKQADTDRFAKFFHGMLAKDIYLPPSQFETGFLSAAHSKEDIENCILTARKVLTAQ